jgi:hypothetical protein
MEIVAQGLRSWKQFHDRVADDPLEEDEQAQHV